MKTVPAVYAFALLYMLALDGLYLGAAHTFYNRVTEAVQKTPSEPNCLAAALCYAAIWAGLVFLALPSILQRITPETSDTDIFVLCLRYGGVLGAVVYGVYNLTNKALLTKYTWGVVALDTVWGFTMMTLATFFTVLSTRAIKRDGDKPQTIKLDTAL